MVGKLVPEFFPKIFGPAQDQPLDAEVVRERFAALAAEIGDGREAAQVADGFIRIAVENMANAILSISVQRGYDVTDYVMNSFGGAGGQHACLVADALGIGSVLLHPLSGVLSAYGMGLAELKATRSRAVLRLLDAEGLAAAEALAAPLADDAKEELEGQGVARAGIRVSVLAHLRYLGTDSALPVPLGTLAELKNVFEAMHRQRFGFTSPDKPIEIEAIEVEALGGGDHPHEPDMPLSIDELPEPQTKTRLFTGGAWHDAPVFLRAGLEPSHCILGPALIIEPHQTVVVEPHWQAEVTAKNHLLLTRATQTRDADRARHQRRSSAARSVQQALHRDCRADGLCAAKHRALGQHQGAARLLLRHLRWRRPARRQRPAYPGASRLDGPQRRDRAARGRRRSQARRCVDAERAL